MKNEERIYNRNIYPEAVILRAVSDYARVGRITVENESPYFRCTFYSEKVSAKRMADEFDNYLIELINAGENRW